MTKNYYSDFDDWLDNIVFREERITPPRDRNPPDMPPLLREARGMADENQWERGEDLFFRQAKLLEKYTDNFKYRGNPVRYYPTYQSLNDRELRGYFTFRTKIRAGEFPNAPLAYLYLYINELINLIGVKKPIDGYNALIEIRDAYGNQNDNLDESLNQWLIDFVVYYNLDVALLRDNAEVASDQYFAVLERISECDQETLIDAVKHIAPRWLARSKFYASNHADMDKVLFRVIKRASAHYDKAHKRTFVEQFFGALSREYYSPFEDAVFCDRRRRRNFSFTVNHQYIYRCRDGLWEVCRRKLTPKTTRKFNNLIKTVDAVMRVESGYGHAIQPELSLKWLLKIIEEESRAVLAEKKRPVHKIQEIDFSQLSRIREDAAATRNRLIVEGEETDIDEEGPAMSEALSASLPSPTPLAGEERQPETLLSSAESRLLLSLLHDRDLSWLRAEGHILSVLVDSINEKLYDIFGDSVLDDTPAIVRDYQAELKKMYPNQA